MKHINIWFTFLALLCGIGCFFFFYQAYPYHLQHREQMLLFTFTWEQVSSYFQHPAALACLMGDFLTQFFHLKVVGPLIVAGTMVLVEWLTFATFRRWMNGWVAMVVSLAVVVWEALRFCNILYPLAGSWALIGGLFLFWYMARLKGRWSFVIGAFLGVFLSYLFVGYGMLVFAVCIAIEAFVRHRKSSHSVDSLHDAASPCHCVQQSVAVSLTTVFLPLVAALFPLATANHFFMMPAESYAYPATV